MNENFKLIDLIDEKKLLYICGNGGAGKTTYAKKIKTQLENAGKSVNMISTDDFITNTKVRNNSVGFWTKSGGQFSGRYTSCCEESYFWSAIDCILFSLKNGLDVFYQPKRSEKVLLKADADLTIIEGIGTAFMQMDDNAVGFWFECEKETEIERRMKRGNLTRQEVVDRLDARDFQFEANVLPNKKNFDFEIKTDGIDLKITKI